MVSNTKRRGLPLVRTLSNLFKRSRSANRPARVAAAAGQWSSIADRGGLEGGLEALEQRTLMFTMTVGPGDNVDPNTGIGSVVMQFGYLLPYLWTQIPEEQTVTPLVEEFADENDQWATNNPPVPPSGTFFSQSEIQIAYSPTGAFVRLEDGPDAGQQGQNDRDLRVQLSGSGFASFSFFEGVQNNMPRLRLTQTASFVIGPSLIGSDGGGLNTDAATGSKVQLLRGGIVVLELSGATLAAIGTPVLGNGQPLMRFDFNLSDGFDTVRFSSAQPPPDNQTYQDIFRIDDITVSFPQGRFGPVHDARIAGAEIVLSGPVGTSVQVFDAYGRDMVATIALGIPQGSQVAIVDPTDTGVPRFNDGIGRINFLAGDSRSKLTMWGGEITTGQAPDEDTRAFENGFLFKLPGSAAGLLDDFEQAGFGYALTQGTDTPTVIGLPAGNASIVIGSPFVRNNATTASYLGELVVRDQQLFSTWQNFLNGAQITDSTLFRNPNQGLFAPAGLNWGTVNINGIMHGQIQFGGSLGRLSTGVQLGNISVNGDLGSLFVASDSGLWVRDDVPDVDDVVIDPDSGFTGFTNSNMTVGRTAGQITIGGRNAMNITVLGDVNNPTRSRVDFRAYQEREVIYTFADQTDADIRDTIEELMDAAFLSQNQFNSFFFGLFFPEQAMAMGLGLYRNDTIQGAEYVGSPNTSVRIVGTMGNRDPISTKRDSADVYAFSATAGIAVNADVVFDFIDIGFDASRGFDTWATARIVDAFGRTVSSQQYPEVSENRLAGSLSLGIRLQFMPTTSDVYYLVMNSPQDGANRLGSNEYEVVLSGMASTTLGGVTVGARMGFTQTPTSIIVQSGSMGMLRVGVGSVDGAGADSDPSAIITTADDIADLLDLRESSIAVAGSLHAVITGADVMGFRGVGVPGTQFSIGGNLGTFRTGFNPLVAADSTNGDVLDLSLDVSGSIGEIDIRGAVRFDQDRGRYPSADRAVSIRTGLAGGRGDIGRISVGARIQGDNFNVTTSPGSIIDEFIADEAGSGLIDAATPRFTLGAGSDLRFASFTQIQSGLNPDVFRPLVPGAPVTLTDDAGGTVTISIENGLAGSVGQIRVLPINGSQGVAISRIDVNLVGGASLLIRGTQQSGRISIGRIVVTTDGGAALSSIIIDGQGQIDVRRIDQTGGRLNLVQNLTAGGDIVMLDVAQVDRVHIAAGDLGRTQTGAPGSTQRLIGSFLGISGTDSGGAVGDPIAVVAANLNAAWNGELYYPLDAFTSDFPDDVALEDIGSPVHPHLNGLRVRGGNVTAIAVSGQVGDVIIQGGGNLGTLIANDDGVRASPGRFEGIVGVIYANDITRIDVGDGVASAGNSAFAAAGIFANDDIIEIVAGRGLNPVISGPIIAANAAADPVGVFNGIGSIRIEGGRIDGAFIGAATLDSFWSSARFIPITAHADDRETRGVVNEIAAVGSPLTRSTIVGININSVVVTGANYDATSIEATGDVGNVFADNFVNSTLLGEPLEFRLNSIKASRNIAFVATHNRAGDISDLTVDAANSITQGVTARRINRLDLHAAGDVQELSAVIDIAATSVSAGRLVLASAGQDIRSSSFDIAGPIFQVVAGANITSTRFSSTGPDGRIDLIQSVGYLTGEIRSEGPINTITSLTADIVAKVSTVGSNGTLALLRAAGNILVDLDAEGDVNTILAGGHIGSRDSTPQARAINVRGNLNIIESQNGQIYSDIKVGNNITGYVRNAAVASVPGFDLVSTGSIRAYGRINSIEIHGDLNGSIISESGGIGSILIVDGSFRPGNRIEARAGTISSFVIVGGHLLGDIYADEDISLVSVRRSATFYGDIGVNPNLSQFTPADALRNQLPPGVAPIPTFQGARIEAGRNVGVVEVTDGSFWESAIVAGHSVGKVFIRGVILNDNITPGLGGSFIIAGDAIGAIDVGAYAGGAIIAAGVTSLGADNRPGGVGINADTVQFGRIGDLLFRGGTGAVTISAGINAGADGIYNTDDDSVADGLSLINSVTVHVGSALTSVYADNGIGFTSPGLIRGGPGLRQANPGRVIEFVPSTGLIANGVPTPFVMPSGETGRITFTGPGQAYFEQTFDAEAGRVIGRLAIINSTLASSVVVDTDQGTLTDFKLISNDGSSLGFASVRASLNGASSFYFDGYVQFAEFGSLNTTGLLGAGNDFGTIVVGQVVRGTIFGNYVNQIIIGLDYGIRGDRQAATIDVLGVGSVIMAGSNYGLITSARDIGSIQVNGNIDTANIRAGLSLGSVQANNVTDSRISAHTRLSSARFFGNVTDSSILAGADLGFDGEYGGTGTNADILDDGNIGAVAISGSFIRSSIVAGSHPGPDRFFGTADDVGDEGLSSIGSVVVAGQAVGSQLNSQAFRIQATGGTLGPVVVGGVNFTANGNLAAIGATPESTPLQVADLRVELESGVYMARITFNQEINSASLAKSLRISEVRSSGNVTIALAEGTDYILSYNEAERTATIAFSAAITSRALPETPALPGPGVYRFELNADTLRGETQNQSLDGNGDGFAAAGDHYSRDAFVGDAGDKLSSNVATANGTTINFRAASDLNQVLDNNYTPDGLPDTNTVLTLRGVLGDHPNHDVNNFGLGGDADVYKVTLLAGQILRLGAMQGGAQLATRALLDANGTTIMSTSSVTSTGTETASVLRLPVNLLASDARSIEDAYLILQTGTYYILVTASPASVDVADNSDVANVTPIGGATGTYQFSVEIFDDGDTGFSATNNAGDGSRIVHAPSPIAFAGADGVLNTADDLGAVAIQNFVFQLNRGTDGIAGTADDIVSGSNGAGISAARMAGADGVFGTADDALSESVSSSIGASAGVGVPSQVQADVDVYHLNNREAILPGTVIRATLDLSEFGSNIGLTQDPRSLDLRGDVQLAVFDTSGSIGITDALLVASSSDIEAVGGQPGHVVSRGSTAYGYDENGNFFIQWVTSGRLDVAGNAPATYAVYVQGAIRSDYVLSINQLGTATSTPVAQNVFVETRGGIIDWLEAGDRQTSLAPFSAAVLGFTGFIGNQTVNDYIVTRLVTNVTNVFRNAGVNIQLSTNAAAFAGQNFSTVFLAGSQAPTAFFNNREFGAAQHVDPFNADPNDQAVVFLPAFSQLVSGPDQADVDVLIQALTAATTRRVAELVGLRMLSNAGQGVVMSANSVTNTSTTYAFSSNNIRLSNNHDTVRGTNFYLGHSNDVALLRRLLPSV
ncbi:MAG: hypothetical protein KF745_07005 [Phycisphaeraceae bacterium]|nr:hypothetical protein [Phycisphaeraceae bacterium]